MLCEIQIELECKEQLFCLPFYLWVHMFFQILWSPDRISPFHEMIETLENCHMSWEVYPSWT